MKNRVLRSTLVVILVIAMVLTMAACGSDEVTATTAPVATTTPAATETPVAPTEAPVVTTAPTVAPTTSVSKDTVADDFGITLEAFDGTYGSDIKNADGDKVKDFDEISSAYGYFLLSIDDSKINDEQYEITIKSGSDVIYSYLYDDGAFVETTATEIAAKDIYDGDNTYDSSSMLEVLVEDTDEIYIAVVDAGVYELELDVLITEKSADYGAWDHDTDREEYETELSAILTVAKEEITISIDPIVVQADTDAVLEISDGTTLYDGSTTINELTVITYEGTDVVKYSAFSNAYDDIEVLVAETDYELSYELSYVKSAAVGTYAVEVTLLDKNGDEYDLDDINDTMTNQTIVGIEDTEIYVISAYDWNELRDVATSIGEILYDTTDDTIVYDDGNYKTQLPLAAARYNALSSQQQAWFVTGAIAQVDANTTIATTNVGNWASDEPYKDYPGYDSLDTISTASVVWAITYYDYMDDAQDVVDENIVIDAFIEVYDDSNMDDYFGTDGYLTSNSSAITAFNTVDTYWNSLSDDDQEIISEDYVVAEYIAYQLAVAAFDEAKVDAALELTAGAYAAYIKALNNGAKVIYQFTSEDDTVNNFSDWAYINSTEVKTLTAQAKAAYDALTDDQQDDYFDVALNGDDDVTVLAEITDVVEYGDSDILYVKALKQLVAMNEMIDTMITISNYVNIEDYSDDASYIVYDRLNALVYGIDIAGTDNLIGMYFPEYTEDDGDYRFAMQDIINAPERNYDAIIAEYQAWIDLVLDFEDYKAELVETFQDGIVAAIADLSTDDYSGASLSTLGDVENTLAEAIADAIMYEGYEYGTYTDISDIDGNDYYASYYDDAKFVVKASDFTRVIVEEFLGKTEEISEIYEMFEDYLEIEDIIDDYIDNIKES